MLITKIKTKLVFINTFLFLLFLASSTLAQTETQLFNIDPSYDLSGRKELTAVLVRTTNQLYFYIDKDWWQKLASSRQIEIEGKLYDLASEFEYKIYPKLTKTFGSEPKPGIDKDEKITILVHPMISETGGYFNSGDVYSKFQNPNSNEREMIYLNSQHIDNPQAKVFLAHEFTHLITVNQKNLLRKVDEETWLNELRAEHSVTLMDYNNPYKNSPLEKRVKDFLQNSDVSLTVWQNKKENYGAVNLFAQYLVDHYGLKILVDSLQSNKISIESLEFALKKNNYDKNFSQIFADWMITLLVNNCSLGEKYCYLNENLKTFKITPTLYYLPKNETVLATHHYVVPWQLSWQKFIGGWAEVSFEFDGIDTMEFENPYLICDLKNNCRVEFLENLDVKQKGKISFSQFNSKYSSITFLPFIKNKTSGFNGKEQTYSFSWQVEVKEKPTIQEETELIQRLLAQIEELKRQIAEYQTKIASIIRRGPISCQRFENNLYFGMGNNSEVRCLQEFLKNQGPEIYPEGLVTGNFLSLTKQAVIRFQERYTSEVLAPLGLKKGTGFVGSLTRTKINQILEKNQK